MTDKNPEVVDVEEAERILRAEGWGPELEAASKKLIRNMMSDLSAKRQAEQQGVDVEELVSAIEKKLEPPRWWEHTIANLSNKQTFLNGARAMARHLIKIGLIGGKNV